MPYANKEDRRAFNRRYYQKNRERLLAYQSYYNGEHGRKIASRDHKRNYGIDLDERDHMLATQGNKCAGCGSTDKGSKKDWHTDHCHATGKVRGILCHYCNMALGNVKDDINRLKSLIEYLKFHGATE